MPKILSVGSSQCPYLIPQTEVKEFVRSSFLSKIQDFDRLLQVFDHAEIDTRSFVEPLSWFESPTSFSQTNELYQKHAVALCNQAVDDCWAQLGRSDIQKEISHIFLITSTGISTPSLDAKILNSGNWNPHIKRTPIWGLGCLGGSVGISRVAEYLRAFPKQSALLVAVEICSLTFQKGDISKSNFIATSLFSDGASAVLLVGDEHPLASKPGYKILDSMSTLYPNTLNVMGWEVKDEGLKVVFHKDIPKIVRDWVKPNLSEFLESNSANLSEIQDWILHPGGKKVLDSYQEALFLEPESLAISRQVLREHGNMSSVTVLDILQQFIKKSKSQPHNQMGILSSLGPGFSSELVLVKGDFFR